MYQKIHENLITNGYHIGKFDEFFNDITGVNSEEFEKWSEEFYSDDNWEMKTDYKKL